MFAQFLWALFERLCEEAPRGETRALPLPNVPKGHKNPWEGDRWFSGQLPAPLTLRHARWGRGTMEPRTLPGKTDHNHPGVSPKIVCPTHATGATFKDFWVSTNICILVIDISFFFPLIKLKVLFSFSSFLKKKFGEKNEINHFVLNVLFMITGIWKLIRRKKIKEKLLLDFR